MGSFVGHVLPGSMFIFFGVFWAYRLAQLSLYSNAGSAHKRQYTKRKKAANDIRLTFGVAKYPRLPFEAFATILLTSLGILIEGVQAVGLPPPGGWLNITNTQHVTMYSVFLVAALSELVMRHRPHLLPLGADYFMLFGAFTLEGLLFYYHIAHQTKFEQSVHLLLVASICSCSFSVLLESFRPNVIDLKRVRAFLVTLQGIWLNQECIIFNNARGTNSRKTALWPNSEVAAFLLYNPIPGSNRPWQSADEHSSIMWVGLIFAWTALLTVFIHFVVNVRVVGWSTKVKNADTVIERRLLSPEKGNDAEFGIPQELQQSDGDNFESTVRNISLSSHSSDECLVPDTNSSSVLMVGT